MPVRNCPSDLSRGFGEKREKRKQGRDPEKSRTREGNLSGHEESFGASREMIVKEAQDQRDAGRRGSSVCRQAVGQRRKHANRERNKVGLGCLPTTRPGKRRYICESDDTSILRVR